MKETVHFTKMQGAGNDYIYVDTQQYDIPDPEKAVFLLIEAIIRRPLNRKVEAIVNAVGLALLFTLMIVVTISDVVGLFR